MTTTHIGPSTPKIYSKEQIDGIRESCKIAAFSLFYIQDFVRKGITTEKLDDIISRVFTRQNATSACLGLHGFPKHCCISVNNVVCHGIPDKYILKNGDIVNIDVAVLHNGYYGDTSRMYTVGKIKRNAQKLLQTTEECLNIGIEQCRPGNPLCQIGIRIDRHAKKHGYSVVKEFCGHGIGENLHEYPPVQHITNYDITTLQPGMVFTIEPILNEGTAGIIINDWDVKTKDGKLSAQYEHTILITDKGHEILT